jgi:hypothetical protein
MKRPHTAGNIANVSKIQIKGVSKLIKENLRRNKNKEEEEVNKQIVEDNR